MIWPTVALADLLETSIGGVWGKPAGEDEVGVRVWRVTELRPGGILDPASAASRSVTVKQYESRALRYGDLLLEKSGGGPTTPVGRVGLVRSVPDPAVCSNFMQLLRPRTERVDPRYLHLYLNHFHSSGGTLSLQTASTNIRNIKTADYLAIRIPLPQVAVQRRIVEILEDHLSRLDAANAYLESSRLRLVAMERSALDSLFGGEDVPLADLIVDISAGKSFGAANAPARDGEWGIIKVSAMTWGAFDPRENKAVPADRVDSRFEIREGDLLVSRANTEAYVGASVRVGAVRPKLLLSDKSLRITPRPGIRGDWLWRALQAPSARRQISGLATGTKESMRNISQDALRKVLLPSATKPEQEGAVHEFAEIWTTISRTRTELDAARRRSTALRRAVLRAAFLGRLTENVSSVVDEMIGE